MNENQSESKTLKQICLMKWVMNLQEVLISMSKSRQKCNEAILKAHSIQIINLHLITCGGMGQSKSIKKRKTLKFGTRLLKFQSNALGIRNEEGQNDHHKHQLRLLPVYQSNQQHYLIEKDMRSLGLKGVEVLEARRRLLEGHFLNTAIQEEMGLILNWFKCLKEKS